MMHSRGAASEASIFARFVRKKSIKQLIRTLLAKKNRGVSAAQPVKAQIFSIGIYAGTSPLELAPARQASNPVLTRDSVTDARAAFVADPFMLQTQGTWHMFFEVMNSQTGKGEIGLATSENGVRWRYQQIVMREPFHLSYPHVFQLNDAYYMVPETCAANSVRLYKAVDFPTRWTYATTLLDGDDFVDPTVFYFNDHWWLFTDLARPPFCAGILRLFRADRLEGPWTEHPKSPVVEGNPHIARPAGRVLVLNEKIVRFTQDCYPTYGTQVRAFEITELTDTRYVEQDVCNTPILTGSGTGWNESGMHHIDPHPIPGDRWIACVDGFFYGSESLG